ncbi:MAG: manganese efflux pump [Clostridia bacterium]|nr:manganese efflux pump [Clostridia bacterium]
MNAMFLVNSAALGAGLAMDAFSVSMANGLHEPCMKKGKTIAIAGVFAFFQAAMPMLGWVCVHTIVEMFGAFQKFIPFIALILLSLIGGKMLCEGIKNKGCEENMGVATFSALLVQGVATSIDALSTGFTISDYSAVMALLCALIIATVTFIICIIGVEVGKKFGTRLAGKAGILGGIILIAIGIEIFITGII